MLLDKNENPEQSGFFYVTILTCTKIKIGTPMKLI